jgi:two-component system LytT family response regulator
MKKIEAIIVDDEESNLDLLEHFLTQYCTYVNIIGRATEKKDAVTIINTQKPELLFLDIQLKGDTGFEVLEELDYDSYRVIFVTAYNEYAVRAFKYNAIDYILKPLQIDELVNAVSKAFIDIEKDLFTNKMQLQMFSKFLLAENHQLDFVAIPFQDKVAFVKLETILYLKSEEGYTVFFLQNSPKKVSSKRLGEYEELLLGDVFFRTHHSYIVNLKQVININKAMGNYCEMSNGALVPIARRRQEKLSRFLKIK